MINNQEIVDFCSAECARQSSGELSVAHFVFTWFEALDVFRHTSHIDIDTVLYLARTIDTRNEWFRYVPAYFDSGEFAIPAYSIERAVEKLLEAQNRLSAAEFYQEFEEIHPFIDGNGRLGALLYNVRLGTLAHPVIPLEYKRRK